MPFSLSLSVALSLLLVCQQAPVRKPSALLALEQQRKSCVVSGRIEWSVLPGGDPDRQLKFVSRFAKNGDTIFEHRGDKYGWTIFEPVMGPGGKIAKRGVQKYPLLYMTNADGHWHHKETTLGAQLWKRDGEPPPDYYWDNVKDILGVGVYPSSESLKSRLAAC